MSRVGHLSLLYVIIISSLDTLSWYKTAGEIISNPPATRSPTRVIPITLPGHVLTATDHSSLKTYSITVRHTCPSQPSFCPCYWDILTFFLACPDTYCPDKSCGQQIPNNRFLGVTQGAKLTPNLFTPFS